MPILPIETARLLLRLPETADARPLMEIIWDAEVVELKQVTLTEPPGGIEMAERNVAQTLRHWQSQGYGQWTVVEKASGHVIGLVGLQNPKGWPGVELAWIIHRSRWGHGFATEAARAALRWAWEQTDLDHIISLINAGDLRSMRVATKIGERFERADVDPIHGEPIHVYGIRRATPNA